MQFNKNKTFRAFLTIDDSAICNQMWFYENKPNDGRMRRHKLYSWDWGAGQRKSVKCVKDCHVIHSPYPYNIGMLKHWLDHTQRSPSTVHPGVWSLVTVTHTASLIRKVWNSGKLNFPAIRSLSFVRTFISRPVKQWNILGATQFKMNHFHSHFSVSAILFHNDNCCVRVLASTWQICFNLFASNGCE